MKKKAIAAVAVLTLGASLAIAAPEAGKFGGKRGHRGEHAMKFAQKLDLTDAQKEQIRAIRQQTRESNAAFLQGVRETRQEFRAAKRGNDTARADSLKATLEAQSAQLRQIREGERQRILAVLTPEQRTQLEALKAERSARHKGKRGQRN